MAYHIASLDVRLKFIVRWGQVYLNRHMNSASLTSSHAAEFHSSFSIRSRLNTKAFSWTADIESIYWLTIS